MVQFVEVLPENCTGCRECEMICSLSHFGECNPELSAVRVVRNEGQGLAEPIPLICRHCDLPACMDACPTAAISKDTDSDRICIDPDACIGCGDCTRACPVGCIFLNTVEMRAIACDLCGGDPQCIPMCHAACLHLSRTGKEEDSSIRVNRLADLLASAVSEAANGKQA